MKIVVIAIRSMLVYLYNLHNFVFWLFNSMVEIFLPLYYDNACNFNSPMVTVFRHIHSNHTQK